MISRLLRLTLTLCLVFACSASAQTDMSKCLDKIQARLDAVGTTDFNLSILKDDIKDYDIGKLSDVLADPDKIVAFKKIYKSLAEFTGLAGNNLSAKGMRGYGRYSGCIIKPGSDDIASLKDAFTKSGAFNGKAFDEIMRQLAKESLFDVDAATRTFTLKNSGLKLKPQSYAAGEKHTINHIVHGHLDNDFSLAEAKSVFDHPNEVFELIDDAWKNRNPVHESGNRYVVDFTPRIIGTAPDGTKLTKLQLFVGSNSDATQLLSAFPKK